MKQRPFVTALLANFLSLAQTNADFVPILEEYPVEQQPGAQPILAVTSGIAPHFTTPPSP